MKFKYVDNSGKLGLFGALNIMIGSLLGAAIYIMLPDIIEGVGTGMFLAFLIGSLPAVFSGVYYIQLNATFPNSGGTYYFSKRLLGKYAGFIASSFLMFGVIGGVAMLANGFSQYFSLYFPGIPVTIPLVGILLLFIIINIFGIRTVSTLQSIMVLIILSALLIFIVPGLIYGSGVETGNYFLPGGSSALFAASVTAFMSYGTFVLLSSLGGKIKNPKRNTPLAMGIGIIGVTIIFMGVTITATMVAPSEMISQSSTALVDISSLYLPEFVSLFIGFSGLLAIATTLNATVTVGATELQILAQNKHLPNYIGKNHRKYQTPTNALLFTGLSTLILLVTGLSQEILMHITIVGILLSVFITGLASLQLPKTEDYKLAMFHFPSWIFYPSIFIGGLLSLGYSVYIFYAYPIIGALLIIFLFLMNGLHYFRHLVSNKISVVKSNKEL
ncbi:APC family permease [Salicibibacter kimchii]|uniref:Amino acid permease n=1 Tax=Salicibibacter kimchii TaxID=2099786 RepID=A0A345C0N9_9BACI|nr:APC family permease [Salicibibacter kimchii]AXF56770.1 amino acid permease [Salicibibacter kimchii]